MYVLFYWRKSHDTTRLHFMFHTQAHPERQNRALAFSGFDENKGHTMTLIILLLICETALFFVNWIEFVERRGRK